MPRTLVGLMTLGLLALGCGDDGGGGGTEGATTTASTGNTQSGTTGTPTPDPTTGSDPDSGSSGSPTTGTPGTTTTGADSTDGSSSTGSAAVLAHADIMGLGDNDGIGTASFTLDGDEVTLVIELQDILPQGLHGTHIHQVGDCSADDGSSAGGHWNPYGNQHGMLGMGESHLGDLGNVEIDAMGSGTLMISTTEWTIGTGDETDVVGRAIIVHEGEDDLSPNPNPGARIACGEIVMGPG